MSTIERWLEAEVGIQKTIRGEDYDAPYLSIQDLILKEGMSFEGRTLNRAATALSFAFMGNERECFKNALTLVSFHPTRLVYCEGYAHRIIPVPHAWAVDTETGAVIEPTWDEVGTEYIGLPFLFEIADEITDARGTYGVLDDWQNDWPLLTSFHRNMLDGRVLERKAA